MLSHSTYCFHHYRAGQLPEVQNLVDNTGKSGVSLGACREYENLEPMLLQEFKNPLRLKMLKVCLLLLSSLLHIDAQAVSAQPSFLDLRFRCYFFPSISHLKQVLTLLEFQAKPTPVWNDISFSVI